jgi:hypothetical protein
MTIDEIIEQAFRKRGLDPAYGRRTAQVESSMDPRASNPNSSAGGLYQFIDDTWRQYGKGRDKFDPVASAEAAADLTAANQKALRYGLGREPTNAELYLAHQQGAGGAMDLINDPDGKAVGDRFALNAGTGGTKGDFARKWMAKFEGRKDGMAVPGTTGETGLPTPASTDDQLKRLMAMFGAQQKKQAAPAAGGANLSAGGALASGFGSAMPDQMDFSKMFAKPGPGNQMMGAGGKTDAAMGNASAGDWGKPAGGGGDMLSKIMSLFG